MAKTQTKTKADAPKPLYYVRTKGKSANFVDHETGLAVSAHQIVAVFSPVGRQTAKFVKGGGLVKVTNPKKIDQAREDGTLVETHVNSLIPNTKIVMQDAPEGSVAAKNNMKVPVEVPLSDDEQEDLDELANGNDPHMTEDDDEELGEGEEENLDTDEDDDDKDNDDKDKPKTKRPDGAKPGFKKKVNGVINKGDKPVTQ